jgi:hypothetical protein
MLAMPTKLAVSFSRGQYENFVLIAILAVLCAYWVYLSFGRLTFARVNEDDAANHRSSVTIDLA